MDTEVSIGRPCEIRGDWPREILAISECPICLTRFWFLKRAGQKERMCGCEHTHDFYREGPAATVWFQYR